MKNLFPVIFAVFFLCVNTAYAQHLLKGNVTDSAGNALPGVNIMERGTASGTVTDLNGGFQFYYSDKNAVIRFTFVGYEPFEIIPLGTEFVEIVMHERTIDLDGIEVVGSRSLNRSALNTPVAVDIIVVPDLFKTSGHVQINQLLQFIAPSFNANRQSGADGSDHIDPATLRGLGPDQTLVLINGKRRHQSSLINIYGSRGRGNSGTDLNTIPLSAIERIEILRDGASAQYGSDALAGVINIVLKSDINEFTGMLTTGVRQAKYRDDRSFDGETVQFSANYGLPLWNKGFMNITTDYQLSERTNRPADPNNYEIYREKFGDAFSENFSTFFNSKIPLYDEAYFYAFGGMSQRLTDAYAWTRTADSDRNIPEIYPDGFNPRILSTITDYSISTGMRGFLGIWHVDFSNTFGQNQFKYTVDGSLNASLLDRTPVRFDAGGFSLSQNTTNLQFSHFFGRIFSGMNLAFGAEFRVERYQIFAGEEASYKNYGLVSIISNGQIITIDELGRPGGSQGFPGFQPKDETNQTRSNVAIFGDAEIDFSSRFMVAAALRAERYSDFGSTVNGKIASRYEFADGFALRNSLSTGFRAPSLAQIYFSSTITDFVSGVAIDKIIAPNVSPITRILGIERLKEEKSINLSLGLTANLGSGWYASIDGYFVDIKDRIVLTGAFEDADPQIGADLQALGVGAAQFFTNAVDTRTIGTDFIINYFGILASGNISTTLAANFNYMSIERVKTNERLRGKEEIYFGSREKSFLLASAPPSKINLSVDYTLNKITSNLMLVRFGAIELEDWDGEIMRYKSKITTDVSVKYQVNWNTSITLGGMNIFNVYPTKQNTETETGGNYDAVQMGFSGAFFYLKLGVRF